MSDIDDCLKSVERLTRERGEVMAKAERLRAEVERLRGEMPVAESLRVDVKCAEIERDEARAVVWNQAKENADLRAEVERLQKRDAEWTEKAAAWMASAGAAQRLDGYRRLASELNEARAEVERMRAVVATLEIVGKAADDERQTMRERIEQLHEIIENNGVPCVIRRLL